MINCTCGSASVSAHIHSAWCDTVQARLKSFYNFCQSEAEKHPKSEYLYITTEGRDPFYVYDHLKNNLMKNWMLTSETTGFYTIIFHNASSITFVNEDKIAQFTRESLDGVYIEHCDHMEKLECSLIPFTILSNGFIKTVEPGSKEMLT